MSKILLGAMVITVLVEFFTHPVQTAGDAAAGEKVFKANCVACHAGGKNAVNPAKNLQKESLVKYKMYSAEAIKTQVTNGKAAMPAFGKTGRLKTPDIENVAAYVLVQSDKGWK